MTLFRRSLLGRTVALAASGALAPARAQNRPPLYTAIAFDGFPLIDPRPVAASAEDLFPGRGAALMEAWRLRQFEYTWLRTLSRRYADFWQVTEEAMVVAARAIKLELTAQARTRLMQTFLELKVWPDVA